VSDPRYPSAFQRPGSATPDGEATAHAVPVPVPEPAPRTRTTAPVPEPERRRRASARPIVAGETERGGNRIVLLGDDDEEPVDAPPSQRNLAIGGLYALAGVLLAIALLGGLWSQGMLRGIDGYGSSVNPDGLIVLDFDGSETGAVGFARLLVQLAPTTLALGVLALLVAIALPVLTRRPR
jgi:hypothetical protein